MCSAHEMNRASIDEEVVAAATTMTAIMMSTGRGGAVVVARRSVPPPPPSRRSRVTAAVASAAAALVAMRNRNSSRRVAPVNVDVAALAAEAVDNIEAEENSSSAGRHAKPTPSTAAVTRRLCRIRLRMPRRSVAVAPTVEEPPILPSSSSPEPRPAIRIRIRLRPQRAAAADAAVPEVAAAVDSDDSSSRTDTDAAASASTKPASEARVGQESTSILRPKAAATADVRVAVTVNQTVVAVIAASRRVLEKSNFKVSEDDTVADAKRPANDDDDAVSSLSHSDASPLAVDGSDNVKARATDACDGDGQDSNRDADDDDDFSDLPPLEEEPSELESPRSVLADTSVDLDVATLPPSKVQQAYVELSTHEREDFHETTRVWSQKELLDWKRRVQESIAERRRSRLRRRPGTPYAGAPVPRRRRPGV